MFRVKNNNAKVTSRNARRHRSLQLESLENRRLMTVNMMVNPSGVLNIRGDDTADIVTVYQSNGKTFVQSTNSVGLTTTKDMGTAVKSLAINTLGGNDVVTNNSNLPASILGGMGDDTLRGGNAADVIQGGDGNDYIVGNGGNDELRGGNGNDGIYGGAGADGLYGDAGNDFLVGGGNSDTVSGGAGDDSVYGDDWTGLAVLDGVMAGDDILYGGDGNDNMGGGFGNDILYGGNGDDGLVGDNGDDRLYGEAGIDRVWGQNGDDFLDAGSMFGELVSGGEGNDFNAYVTVVNGASTEDFYQGNSNNCFILSSLGVLAKQGINMGSRISYVGKGVYNVSLFERTATGAYNPITVSVAFDGTLRDTDPTAHYRGQEGESWTIIMNRAVAQLLKVNLQLTLGGYAGDVLAAVVGRAPSTMTWKDTSGGNSMFYRDPALEYLFAVGNSRPTIVSTFNAGARDTTLFAEAHVYMVEAVTISGYNYFNGQYIPQYSVVLRNPHGVDNRDVGKVMNARSSGNNSDGMIVISGAEFKRSFAEITLV